MTDERLPPPPVEPLPDLTWARLERQLWATLDAPVGRGAAQPARSLALAGGGRRLGGCGRRGRPGLALAAG
jgi:hypothetical protein